MHIQSQMSKSGDGMESQCRQQRPCQHAAREALEKFSGPIETFSRTKGKLEQIQTQWQAQKKQHTSDAMQNGNPGLWWQIQPKQIKILWSAIHVD